MKFKMIVTVFALCIALPAAAQFKVTSRAYEVSLEGFQAPAHTAGGVVFRPCSQCPLKRMRVTDETLYKVKGERVRLEDFRRAIESAPEPDDVSVTVKHHLKRDVIEMLDVWL